MSFGVSTAVMRASGSTALTAPEATISSMKSLAAWSDRALSEAIRVPPVARARSSLTVTPCCLAALPQAFARPSGVALPGVFLKLTMNCVYASPALTSGAGTFSVATGPVPGAASTGVTARVMVPTTAASDRARTRDFLSDALPMGSAFYDRALRNARNWVWRPPGKIPGRPKVNVKAFSGFVNY